MGCLLPPRRFVNHADPIQSTLENGYPLQWRTNMSAYIPLWTREFLRLLFIDCKSFLKQADEPAVIMHTAGGRRKRLGVGGKAWFARGEIWMVPFNVSGWKSGANCLVYFTWMFHGAPVLITSSPWFPLSKNQDQMQCTQSKCKIILWLRKCLDTTDGSCNGHCLAQICMLTGLHCWHVFAMASLTGT